MKDLIINNNVDSCLALPPDFSKKWQRKRMRDLLGGGGNGEKVLIFLLSLFFSTWIEGGK